MVAKNEFYPIISKQLPKTSEKKEKESIFCIKK